MKVSQRAYTMATKILNTFDSDTLKAKELDKLSDQQAQLDKKLKEMKDAPELGELHYKKWDLIEKSVDISEKKEEVEEKQGFGVDEKQMKEMLGCSRDHSKEIDIYDKPYKEKLERVMHMKDEGNQSYKEAQYDKASYYYAQALLIFYYLIPETEAEERESESLKRVCHRN